MKTPGIAKVILPIPSLKYTEIYAPTYKDCESVVLIRFPHGGTFEIPELIVNNKHKTAKSILGNAVDAVGINEKVAARLSGADFDGSDYVREFDYSRLTGQMLKIWALLKICLKE